MSETSRGCCTPHRRVEHRPIPPRREPDSRETRSTAGMVLVPEGSFLMGSESPPAYPQDGEGPVRRVATEAYWIDVCAVSNADFATFVEHTGHHTTAEREGWSFVFGGLLPDDFPPTRGVAAAPWWREVPGADWRHPEGPHSDLSSRAEHPVVQVTADDAAAYAAWAGKRLPREAEWERAARGGLERKAFPWGDDLEPEGKHLMNVWQGTFPQHNTEADGWYGTCPVDTYPPNGLGLHNCTGNVWEWCSDPFDAHPTRRVPPGAALVTRGGSYLCHASYCARYRVTARSPMTSDSRCGNVGFRCVMNPVERERPPSA